VAPSDHIILDETEFLRIANLAIDFVSKSNALATLGIRPTRPDTGYGYIQFVEEETLPGIHKVKTFTEKPQKAVAEQFIKSGDFLWNAGIFIWNVKSIITALEQNLLEIYDAFVEIEPDLLTPNENAAVEKAFITSSNISIDYGVMEKAKNVYVLPSSFGWSDLGTWASLYSEKEKDYLQNAVNGKNVVVYDAQNNIINVPDDKLVVLQGLDNFIVIDTEDVLLICKKDEEQRIKEFTHDIKMNKGDKFL
jgi:mannose-1-phosphate guanylyltransferase